MLADVLKKNLDCTTCTARLKIERGCDGPRKAPYDFRGDKFYICPRRPIYEDEEGYEELIWSYVNFRERHILPDSGGMNDQVNEWVDYAQVLDSAWADAQRDLEERRKKN